MDCIVIGVTKSLSLVIDFKCGESEKDILYFIHLYVESKK